MKFWRYLEDEPKNFLSAAGYFLLYFCAYELYVYALLIWPRDFFNFEFLGAKTYVFFSYEAATEELFFRSLPFYLCFDFFKEKEKARKIAMLAAWFLWSFLLFALFHYLFGIVARITLAQSVMFTGIEGFILGFLYLKYGGAAKKIMKPVAVCILFHLAHNVYIASAIFK